MCSRSRCWAIMRGSFSGYFSASRLQLTSNWSSCARLLHLFVFMLAYFTFYGLPLQSLLMRGMRLMSKCCALVQFKNAGCSSCTFVQCQYFFVTSPVILFWRFCVVRCFVSDLGVLLMSLHADASCWLDRACCLVCTYSLVVCNHNCNNVSWACCCRFSYAHRTSFGQLVSDAWYAAGSHCPSVAQSYRLSLPEGI